MLNDTHDTDRRSDVDSAKPEVPQPDEGRPTTSERVPEGGVPPNDGPVGDQPERVQQTGPTRTEVGDLPPVRVEGGHTGTSENGDDSFGRQRLRPEVGSDAREPSGRMVHTCREWCSRYHLLACTPRPVRPGKGRDRPERND